MRRNIHFMLTGNKKDATTDNKMMCLQLLSVKNKHFDYVKVLCLLHTLKVLCVSKICAS